MFWRVWENLGETVPRTGCVRRDVYCCLTGNGDGDGDAVGEDEREFGLDSLAAGRRRDSLCDEQAEDS